MKGGGEIKRLARARLLSREELALWRHVTADVKPRVAAAARSLELAAAPGVGPKSAAGSTPTVVAPLPEPTTKTKPMLPLAPLEKRLKRRLSAGKAQVDDALDLHGMTQAQAHRALNAFLWRAAEDGARLVLVITGKGALADEEGGAPGRGVLRRNVPHWLRAPELRAVVLSVEEAMRPHGGAGALYVRLRRRVC
ncbi:Smr/MutS family protein [Rhodoblastus sp.]|uniref:Smr/MutS family protein n=1 Tax=Rhodoblastus sp. TaxID=1962975 RepID=UPI0026310411|nr:Smr/MutS family protein [Rhodoblastus sp.]